MSVKTKIARIERDKYITVFYVRGYDFQLHCGYEHGYLSESQAQKEYNQLSRDPFAEYNYSLEIETTYK